MRTKASRSSVSGIIYESSDTATAVTIKLFTKQGCTLCDKVKDVLVAVRDEHPHTLVAVDITDDDQREWWDKYKYDIPVLHLDNQYWTKHRLTRDEAVKGITSIQTGQFESPAGEPNAAEMERS